MRPAAVCSGLVRGSFVLLFFADGNCDKAHRFALRCKTSARRTRADDHRQRRHVRRRRRAPGGAGRVRGRPRGGIASLHGAADRFRPGRHPHGTARRSSRRDGAAADRRGLRGAWLHARVAVLEHLVVLGGALPVHRLSGQLRLVRAADRRYVAVVRQAPRDRRGRVRERQLSGRRGVAADRLALHAERGVADDLPRDRRLLRTQHDGAGVVHARAAADVHARHCNRCVGDGGPRIGPSG